MLVEHARDHSARCSDPGIDTVGRTPVSPLRLLLIDSDEAFLHTAWRELTERGRGLEIDTVRDGELALSAIRSGRYDVIVASPTLPGWDAMTVIEAARPLPARPHIIFLGDPSEQTKQEAATSGYLWLRKPVDWEALASTILTQGL
ncbi:response regulator [Candidatus Nitrospira bockiana]